MDKKRKKKILAKEILLLLIVSAVIALFFLVFSRALAESLVFNYTEKMQITLTEMQELNMESMIRNISLLVSVMLFVTLFLFLLGQKLAYLQVILEGIEALRIHRMDYVIPLEGENELTDLAKSINYLSETERQIGAKEKELQKERENLIRALSHDIRTPLTSIYAYTEYMTGKESVTKEELQEYLALMMKKSEQMKQLTDQLLENSRHNPEWVENGRFLLEQLAMEWEEMLEERFQCEIDLSGCPDFSGSIDIGEFRRIFDNLLSNVEKYADSNSPVELSVEKKDTSLIIRQKNKKRKNRTNTESHQIGLLSIKSIAANYDGTVVIKENEDSFEIQISLLEIS